MGLRPEPVWIDFGRSHITWRTKAEHSYGRFSMEAVCSANSASGKTETGHLAAMVVAGKVYAADDIVQTPSYTFQFITENGRRHVFRNFVSWEDAGDSVDAIEDVFADLTIRRIETDTRVINNAEDVISATLAGRPLNARMNLGNKSGCRWAVLDFPVKHINAQPDTGRFQVETGPVAIPSEFLPGETDTYLLAYVIFNRLDRAELALWTPTPIGNATTRFYSRVRKIEAEIEFFTPADSVSGAK